MSDYNKELAYRLDLFNLLSGQWEADQLAEQLIEYGKLNGCADSQSSLDVIQDLVLNIKTDQWQLQRFREAYLVGIVSLPDSERTRVADRVRALCEAQFPFLRKSLGFQLRELKEMLIRLERQLQN